nr:uncharacterized protein CTRU02_07843 [Colletotrichum truncatum]KAF6790937.1 hypothetical protein CTRU02_07843 [Colletotrichum truncatum]
MLVSSFESVITVGLIFCSTIITAMPNVQPGAAVRHIDSRAERVDIGPRGKSRGSRKTSAASTREAATCEECG